MTFAFSFNRNVLVLAFLSSVRVEKPLQRTSRLLSTWMRHSICIKGESHHSNYIRIIVDLTLFSPSACRGMIEPIFTREHIDAMRPHIQKTVDSLLDNMIKEGGEKPVELVEKFSLPVPSFVSSSVLDRDSGLMSLLMHKFLGT